MVSTSCSASARMVQTAIEPGIGGLAHLAREARHLSASSGEGKPASRSVKAARPRANALIEHIGRGGLSAAPAPAPAASAIRVGRPGAGFESFENRPLPAGAHARMQVDRYQFDAGRDAKRRVRSVLKRHFHEVEKSARYRARP